MTKVCNRKQSNLAIYLDSGSAMKRCATISADIVASTSLSPRELMRLTQQIKATLDQLTKKYSGFWGRLVKGDSIECVIKDPKYSLRIALLLKALVKSFVPSDGIADEEFLRHGLRVAIGIGKMRMVKKDLDIMDGEAIYLSGRTLAMMKSKRLYDFQIALSPDLRDIFEIPIDEPLVNFTIDQATNRQCETMFYRLQTDRDKDVAEIMKISRAGVNNNLLRLGWDVLSNTIDKFEKVNYELTRAEKIIALLKKESMELLQNGDPEEALFYLNEAYNICNRKYGSRHLLMAEIYMDYVNLLMSRHDFRNAFEICQKAIVIRKKELGKDDASTVDADNCLKKIQTIFAKNNRSKDKIYFIDFNALNNITIGHTACYLWNQNTALSLWKQKEKYEQHKGNSCIQTKQKNKAQNEPYTIISNNVPKKKNLKDIIEELRKGKNGEYKRLKEFFDEIIILGKNTRRNLESKSITIDDKRESDKKRDKVHKSKSETSYNKKLKKSIKIILLPHTEQKQKLQI